MNTNDLNPLESQLRSWTPRRPSPALEQRLFGKPVPTAALPEMPVRRLPGWGWLAPVACLFVLALQLGTPDSSDRLPRGNMPATFASLSFSNQILTAYAPGWMHSNHNGPIRETFESTNWTTAPSPMRTLPVALSLTNGLIQ